jgi:S1-C subfamily serine protease
VFFKPLLLIALSLSQEETTLQKLEKEISAVVEKVRPSVVRIQSDHLTFSGVVYSKDGHVLTDASGVEQAAEIHVLVGDRTYAAERVDADKRTGVAVLKISAKELKPALFSSGETRTGTTAIVVGNAFGPSSLSFGTIGAIGRSIMIKGRKYENMLQMSAPVHPGDCGGFVADSVGRCLGLIHSAGAVEAIDGKILPAPAFAVPAAWVKFSADRIIKYGHMVRGWLGASLLPLDEAARSQLGLEEGVGAEIARVDRDSPAARAGLALRDVVVSFEGELIRDLEALQWRIAGIESPTRVKLSFLRNRQLHHAETQIEIDPQK